MIVVSTTVVRGNFSLQSLIVAGGELDRCRGGFEEREIGKWEMMG